jgi:hypothetical protein
VRPRPLALLTLALSAIVSFSVAGANAAAWTRIDTREKVLGFFALVAFLMAIDSLIKARAGVPIVPPGPFRVRLVASGLLTLVAAVLLGMQIAKTGFAFEFLLIVDALFLSFGLVLLGQTLLAA